MNINLVSLIGIGIGLLIIFMGFASMPRKKDPPVSNSLKTSWLSFKGNNGITLVVVGVGVICFIVYLAFTHRPNSNEKEQPQSSYQQIDASSNKQNSVVYNNFERSENLVKKSDDTALITDKKNLIDSHNKKTIFPETSHVEEHEIKNDNNRIYTTPKKPPHREYVYQMPKNIPVVIVKESRFGADKGRLVLWTNCSVCLWNIYIDGQLKLSNTYIGTESPYTNSSAINATYLDIMSGNHVLIAVPNEGKKITQNIHVSEGYWVQTCLIQP